MTTHPEIFILLDQDQPRDHGGDPVAPLTTSGQNYLYALRDPERATTTYATSADALLSTLIDGYNPRDLDGTDPDADHTLETTRIAQRARHARSLAINHAAQAILAGAKDATVATLQRATTYQPPLTAQELTAHHDPQWPLLLISAFYEGPDTPQPPAGDVALLRTHDPVDYLRDLHNAGQIILLEHSSTTPAVTVLADLDPDPVLALPTHLDRLEQSLAYLHDNPTDQATAAVREHTEAVLRLAATVEPPEILDPVRAAIASATTPQDLWRVTRDQLLQPIREHFDPANFSGDATGADHDQHDQDEQ